ASSGGKASRSRKAVMNCAQTKNGRRIQVMPGARSWMIVAMKFTEPSSDAVILKIMPTSQSVCPFMNGCSGVASAMPAKGGYDVQPDLAAPPGMTKLKSMITQLMKKHQ